MWKKSKSVHTFWRPSESIQTPWLFPHFVKTCYRALRSSNWGEGSPSNRTTTLSTQPIQRRSGSGCPWVAQPEPGLDPDRPSLERHENNNPPHPTWQLERSCREEWEKLPKYRCAKLVALYPRRLEAVITAKGASTKYWVKVWILM